MAVQFILSNFVNYSLSVAMELEVSKLKQNQRSETNKYLCLLRIIFEVTSSRDQLRKNVRLNSFRKLYFQSVSIFFNFAHRLKRLFSCFS